MRKLIVLASSILCFCFFFCGMFTVHAAKALPPGMVIGDSDGMYATSEGEYYIDLVDILPGDVFEKEITIRSLDLEEPFSLGMLVEEIDSSGSVDWKNHITMTLVLDGKEIYQGPLLGDASRDWSKTPLELGICTYGTDKIMHATFTIDSSLTNENLSEKSTLNFIWNFVGTKDQSPAPTPPTKPTKPTEPSTEPTVPSTPPSSSGNLPATGQGTPTTRKLLPQTGEELVYLFLTGLLLVLIVLFLWKKRREEEQE